MYLSHNDMYKLAMDWFDWWASDKWVDIKFHQYKNRVYYTLPDNALRHMYIPEGKVTSIKFNEAYGRLDVVATTVEEVNEITLELSVS